MAWISIAHRISGVVLFLGLPYVYWVLSQCLHSPQGFHRYCILWHQHGLHFFAGLILILGFLYHTLAGARHLIMDFGYAENLRSGKISAWFVLVGFIALSSCLTWSLW